MPPVNPKISKITIFKITVFLLIILAGLSIIEFNLFFKHPKTTSVCLSDYLTDKSKGCFQVEIVSSFFEQKRGLMNKKSFYKKKKKIFLFFF